MERSQYQLGKTKVFVKAPESVIMSSLMIFYYDEITIIISREKL